MKYPGNMQNEKHDCINEGNLHDVNQGVKIFIRGLSIRIDNIFIREVRELRRCLIMNEYDMNFETILY